MTACGILNQDGQRKGADSCLAIRHKDAMTDDEIIFAVEAFAFDAGPVTAERRNRGFTLFHVATGTPIAGLRPVKGHDGLFDILYRTFLALRPRGALGPADQATNFADQTTCGAKEPD
jgi:hypothetical protein